MNSVLSTCIRYLLLDVILLLFQLATEEETEDREVVAVAAEPVPVELVAVSQDENIPWDAPPGTCLLCRMIKFEA